MRQPVQAVFGNGGIKGGVLYVEAPVHSFIMSAYSDPYVPAMMPFHNGLCWVLEISPTPNFSQTISIRLDGIQVGFMTFIWSKDGPRIAYVKDMQIKHRELNATV